MFTIYTSEEIEELVVAEKEPKEPIKSRAVFQSLREKSPAPKKIVQSQEPTIDLKKLSQICPVQRYSAGKKICAEGEVQKDIYVIVRGVVILAAKGAEPRTLGSGDIVGETSMLSKIPSKETVEFFTEGVALLVNYDNLKKAILLEPELGYKLIASLAEYISSKNVNG